MAVIQHYLEFQPDCFPCIAAGFGGGIGGTHDEVCGALAGGVMAIGCVLGKTGKSAGIKPGCAALRHMFDNEFYTTNCGKLLAEYKESHCVQFVRFAAEASIRILYEYSKKAG